MELKYGFLLQDFNAKNFQYVSESLQMAHLRKRQLLELPDSNGKALYTKRLDAEIEMYEWYIETYPSLIESIRQSGIIPFPSSFRG